MTIPSSEGATPVMAQWFSLKDWYPDALLFFRMGDFFELFFSDAEAAANALDIALTSRGTHGGNPIPMCGVPVGTASNYLSRLIKKGFKVAVAEQTETPADRPKGQKGPLSRAVVRLITPGTLTEDELLHAGQANYIASIIPHLKNKGSTIGVAWVDISTGFFETTFIDHSKLNDLLGRINPSEILCCKDIILNDYDNRRTLIRDHHSLKTAEKELSELFNVNTFDALGNFSDEEIIASFELVHYIQKTQAGKIPQLARPQSQQYETILAIDPATRNSLDILQNSNGSQKFTLFSSVSYTVTASGARMLANWLSAPLTQIKYIKQRQEGWIYLHQNAALLDELRKILKGAPDIARALSRLSLGRGQPRDLASIRNGLEISRNIAHIFKKYEKETGRYCSIIQNTSGYLLYGEELLIKLRTALNENPPLKVEEGFIIKEGYNDELDAYRRLKDNSRQVIISLQEEYKTKFNINTLKIKHHNQLGHIIEVSNAAGSKLREHPDLILRQGTANLSRFTTVQLNELSEKILEANSLAADKEWQLFSELIEEALKEKKLPLLAKSIAMIDVLQSCATLYLSYHWCVPTLSDDTVFKLTNCRHPIVEAALRHKANFTPNSCDLSQKTKIMLLTGPNMAGKSTFLRQVALCVILAQAGLPVPAEEAEIGIVDHLFSRVGASDDLAHGRSTFMVEMTEAAAILNQAGPRSLVVIDEIGRGTSTLDGMAIAWAMLETLHNIIQCRTIFATHFHELVQSTKHLKSCKPFTMKVQEWKNSIIFQYEVIPGAAEHSWGIHVAQLAGVPLPTLKRAGQILQNLEKQYLNPQITLPLPTPCIEEKNKQETLPKKYEKIVDLIKTIDPDELTPKKSLNILYELKNLIDK
ncbi:DNA mismatch repair protein MutS [Commensalibacter papalotli (ex Servin-Garciduenas et al. 2014)]|uniref:DNA mismatch repair protein MutS n=1 Tax=Commensalibacter papalotli (ex Servin-Garciduenas et al. 2014) TaxID=1208583 RepID=W7DVH9_9PROT|nr:DNA mismatch repair protein MutS [Commensalibacter papalotli (ex Servin-Garciduenas et al. 2014)]EUK19045.1 DNA mismatch repair protein MutS [Commensalibacter papalotli (ex Servin-Garciduenas et al. 2014)]